MLSWTERGVIIVLVAAEMIGAWLRPMKRQYSPGLAVCATIAVLALVLAFSSVVHAQQMNRQNSALQTKVKALQQLVDLRAPLR